MSLRILAAILLTCAVTDMAMAAATRGRQDTTQMQQFDCSRLASMPNAGMTVQQCQAMMGMAQSAQAAMNDPSSMRPGDENMSCADIQTELGTMNIAGVSADHRAEGVRSGTVLQQQLAKNQAEVNALAVKQATEVEAAAMADRAVEAATGGVVRGRATDALMPSLQAEQKALGERQVKDTTPKFQAALGSATASANDLTQQMQANPRFGRLMKLAMDKGCRRPGR